MINTEPWALRDLFEHVIAGRANSGDIDALIGWLREQQISLFSCQGKQGRCPKRPKWIYNSWGIEERYCGYCARQFKKSGLRPIEEN